ncbi:MAG: type II toxin-antitoxin system VapC family toxin [Alkalispirochaeta sp.]|jgi:tRNA(fMet)-specific endonuclease VapC
MILFDTTVLIDLERESQRGTPGPVVSFLQSIPEEHPAISVITVGEFGEGFVEHTFEAFSSRLVPYTVILIDERIAWRYALISREGRSKGIRIGDNDLWIAATAIEHRLCVLTRNTRHFNRITGLLVQEY